MTSIRLPKRLFDLVGAVGGLLAFSPAMAVIAGAIVLEPLPVRTGRCVVPSGA